MTDRNLETGHKAPSIGSELRQHTAESAHEQPGAHGGSRWGHHLMMLVCCIPMLVVAGALVVTGAVGAGAIVYAVICMAMMAAMMLFMPGHKH